MNERTESRDVQVVLVAGAHERLALEQVEGALRMRGIAAVLVGADDDAAIAHAHAQLSDVGLVVLGRGPTFAGDRVDAVRQLLSARGLPMSRTLTLGIDEGVRALETRVLAAVQRLSASATPRHSTVPPVHSAFVAPAIAPLADAMPPSSAAPDPGWPAATDGIPTRARARGRRWLVILASAAAVAAGWVTARIVRNIERAPVAADEHASADAPAEPHPVPARVEPTVESTPTPETVEIGEAPAAPTAAPAAAPTVEDAPEVVAALRKRDVRALDLVVISPEAAKAADFAGASAYCDALVIADLDGWRLPEIGELISIARAKMVRRGAFWSATKGDAFGDLRLVLTLKKERINPIGVGWNAGRVVCVRERA